MNNHELNGKHESVQEFAKLGKTILNLKIIVHILFIDLLIIYSICVVLDNDAQELINAAIKAREFSYRCV